MASGWGRGQGNQRDCEDRQDQVQSSALTLIASVFNKVTESLRAPISSFGDGIPMASVKN